MTDLKKVVRRVARNAMSVRGFNPDLVVTLYPHNLLGLREARRRKEYTIPLATIMVMAVQRDINERRKARKRG